MDLYRADCIQLRGARQNNLQGFDLDIPLHALSVICGVSGSGKTSLALDTLYAEGQRRYVESFSAYTRQFLERIDKPKYESLTHLPASIAVTRENRGRNNRSTVGTATEILEYLRILFSKHASLSCYECQRPVIAHTPGTVLASLRTLHGMKGLVCFEARWDDRQSLANQLFELQASGFVRMIAGEKIVHLSDDSRASLAKAFNRKGSALVVVDRIVFANEGRESERIEQSIATAFEHSFLEGRRSVVMLVPSSKLDMPTPSKAETTIADGVTYDVLRFSSDLRCEHCGIDYPALEPSLFNFNSPIGACSTCEGFGETIAIDRAKVIPDPTLTIRQGAIAPWRTPAYTHEWEELVALAQEYDVPLDVPVSKLLKKHWRIIEEGVPERNFGGLNGFFAWLERKKYKLHVRAFLARWRTYSECQTCHGLRLNRSSLAYRWANHNFAELCNMPVRNLSEIIDSIPTLNIESTELSIGTATPYASSSLLVAERRPPARLSEPHQQVRQRLGYLDAVGLSFLSLSRPMHTLSSGEAQRVMMTGLLGSSLVDMLYVLDEPTVGLHPQDSERIANAILGLRDRGNTVLVVEHEPHLIRLADRVFEIGPQAGDHGGKLTFAGTPKELLNSSCLTGEYLQGKRRVSRQRREIDTRCPWLVLQGASGRNLQQLELRVPVNRFTVMVGPSGSGKSSLVLDTLCPSIMQRIDAEFDSAPLPHDDVSGSENLRGCIAIDQSPIPRSNRSCPATYTKAMDDIRELYAASADARARGFGPGHFSFNSEAGRCPQCEGLGYTVVEMQFMADMQLTCLDCDGRRFKSEVLEIRYRDLNIHEVLSLSVERASTFFRGATSIQQKLQPLLDLGLGYLPLGQSLATLSAGESMRLKLASHLTNRSGRDQRGQLIVMDEPTTGLHFADVERLVLCIDRLIDYGNTVLVIEHNTAMMHCADYVIELGPGAGVDGGRIIAQGPFEPWRSDPNSVTAPFLDP
jgi:excinuclease ABC subunit A